LEPGVIECYDFWSINKAISLFLTSANKSNKFCVRLKSITGKIVNILKFTAESGIYAYFLRFQKKKATKLEDITKTLFYYHVLKIKKY
jgi:hypothetical protein